MTDKPQDMGSAVSRFAVNDAHRCQKYAGMPAHCPYRVEDDDLADGQIYCPIHLAEIKVRTKAVSYSKRLDMYRLKEWQTRLNEMKDSTEFKSLRDEIGILRITLEQVVNLCNSPSDVLMHAARLADLGDRIHRMVVACNKLEKQNGLLLDKSAAIAMGGRIVEIIANHVTDPKVVEAIASDIIRVIQEAEPTDGEED